MRDLLLAWLGTYALHGTVLLSLAWLAASRLSTEHARLKEMIWRAALVGGLLTASVQTAFGLEPLAGRIGLRNEPAPVLREREPAIVVLRTLPTERAERADVSLAPAATEPAPDPIHVDTPVERALAPPSPRSILLAAWAAGALLALLRLAGAHRRLACLLKERVELREGPFAECLDGLAREVGARRPRLTVSPKLGTPITVGVRRPEICVPARALAELGPGEVRALLAHELAHVLRRDAAWLALSSVLEAVFFFQPLLRVARRQLAEVAELVCDDWATRRGVAPVELARCLTRVAGWMRHRRALPAVAMSGGSRLGARVERLLAADALPLRRAPRALGTGLALGVSVFAASAPGFGRATVEAPEPPVPTTDEPAADDLEDLVQTFRQLDLELSILAAEVELLKANTSQRELSEPARAKLALVEHGVERLRALRARFLALAAASGPTPTPISPLADLRSKKP